MVVGWEARSEEVRFQLDVVFYPRASWRHGTDASLNDAKLFKWVIRRRRLVAAAEYFNVAILAMELP